MGCKQTPLQQLPTTCQWSSWQSPYTQCVGNMLATFLFYYELAYLLKLFNFKKSALVGLSFKLLCFCYTKEHLRTKRFTWSGQRRSHPTCLPYSVSALGICTDQLCGRSNYALVSDKTYRGTSITSVLLEKPSAWQQCRIQDWGNWDGAREDEERLWLGIIMQLIFSYFTFCYWIDKVRVSVEDQYFERIAFHWLRCYQT